MQSIESARLWFSDLGKTLSEKDAEIAVRILKEITERLTFLNNVGLGYLSLDRIAGTLSGGEAQRIRLASQIGSGFERGVRPIGLWSISMILSIFPTPVNRL